MAARRRGNFTKSGVSVRKKRAVDLLNILKIAVNSPGQELLCVHMIICCPEESSSLFNHYEMISVL